MAQLTEDEIDIVGYRMREGRSTSVIAQALGMTRNALSGAVYRLRQSGDTRIPPAGVGAVATKEDQRNALADAFAEGAETVAVAAKRAGLALSKANDRWQEVRARLGWQAV